MSDEKEANIVSQADLSKALAKAQLPAAAQLFLQEAKGPRESAQKLSLISIDHKNALFVLPSGEKVPDISGFPVYYFRTRRFYKKPPRPGDKGSPPDCFSADMIVPHDNSLEKQADTCDECPFSKFQTGRDGRSQACSTYLWIFLANSAFRPIPVGVVQAPPSSLRILLGTRFQAGYFSMLENRFGCYELVWTKFKLKAQGGQDASVQYCTLDPIMGRALSVDNEEQKADVMRLVALRNNLIHLMEEFRLRTTDIEEQEEPANDASGS